MRRPVSSVRSLRALMRRQLPSKVFKRLEKTGRLAEQAGVSIFVVGGLVRDLLLGHKNLDVDITVEGDGMAFARLLADDCHGALKIFDRFATAFVIYPDRFKVDVASARRESYAQPTALPNVAPASIAEDLARRDFTINALAIRLNRSRFGEMIDPCDGRRDLNRKTIRVLHNRSFVDDPTRIFRAIRFEQRYGFRIEPQTVTLLKAAVAADLIDRLSGPRLRNELMLLLSERDPLPAIQRLARYKLLRFLHVHLTLTPALSARLAGLAGALAWWQRRFPDRPVERSLVYFTALVSELSRPALEAVVKRLALSNREASTARMTRKGLLPAVRGMSKNRLRPSETFRLLAALPEEGLIVLAAQVRSLRMKRLLAAHLRDRLAHPALTGHDLKILGVQPGPLYKTILDRLRDARLNGEVTTAAGERDLAKKIARL